jgi:hypothetical protein
MMSHRVRYWFGIGNLVIACVLAIADYSLPKNTVWLDLPVATVALLLWVGGFGALFRQRWAIQWMRLSAMALLAFGLLSIALLGLTAAFLFGVHGHFLRDGAELVVVGLALLVPYALIYPLLVLTNVKLGVAGSNR